MTAPTQPVTVKLSDFGGPARAGITVTARMSGVDYTADGIFVDNVPVSGVTDATGTVVLNVFPNAVSPAGLGTRGTTVRVTAQIPGSRPLDVQAMVPNTPCTLVAALVPSDAVSLTEAELALLALNNAEALAQNWATLTTGTVDGAEYSSKEHAVGTQASTGGSAKDWATKTTGQVDSAGFSAKEFAQGVQGATGGSAKNWAQYTGDDVPGTAAGSRSSKSWAQENLTPAGFNLGGSAKDWAISTSLPDGVNKSAKSQAADAAASRTAIDDRIYPGTYNPAAAPTTKPVSGNPSANGDEFSGTDGFRYARIGGVWVNQTAAAAASATAASGSATAAGTSETSALSSKAAAQGAQTAAEAARDASFALGPKYTTEPLGRAAVADGATFLVVPGANGAAADEYRRVNSGSSTLIASYPSAATVTSNSELGTANKTGIAEVDSAVGTEDKVSLAVTNVVTSGGLLFSGVSGRFFQWASGFLPTEKRLDYVALVVDSMLSNLTIRLKLWKRAAASAYTGAPDAAQGDVQIYTNDYAASGFTASDATQTITLRFPQLVIPNNFIVLWEIDAIAAGGGNGRIGMGKHQPAVGANAYQNGYFRQYDVDGVTPLAWTAVSAGTSLAFTAGFVGVIAANANARIGVLERTASDATVVYSTTVTPNNPGTIYTYASNFRGWAVGLMTDKTTLDKLTFNTDGLNQNQKLRLRLWKRAAAAVYTGSPDATQGDVLALAQEYLTSAFQNTLAAQTISLSFTPQTKLSTEIWVVELEPVLADGTTGFIGIGRTNNVPGTSQVERGYVKQTAGSFSWASIVWNNIAAPGGLAAAPIVGSSYDRHIADTTYLKVPPASIYSDALSRFVPVGSVAGLRVSVTGEVTAEGVTTAIAGSVVLTAAATGSETVASTLKYNTNQAFGLNSNTWLGRKNISAVVVTRTSDSVVLTAGVDYAVNARGKLRGLVNIADFAVSVNYTYQRERYDVILLDPTTLTLSVVAGTERDWDAQEYISTSYAGKVPIFNALLQGSAVTLLPVYQFDGITKIGTEADWVRLRERNRKALKKTMGRVQRGLAVTIAGYGDSITAMQNAAPAYTANGVSRDREDGFFSPYPADTRALFTKYDFGDGAGAVHTKEGWNWQLKAHLEAISGATCTYLNFGIGGTTSANSVDNGLYPARIAQVVAAAPHLAVIAFGMNELGSSATYANIVSIIQQLQAVGTECIVSAVPRPIIAEGVATLANWQLTNRQLYRAAVDTGSAFCPLNWISDDRNLGGLGLSEWTMCGVNFYNHPGYYELRRYGDLLTRAL